MTGMQPDDARPDQVDNGQPDTAPGPATARLSGSVTTATGSGNCHGQAPTDPGQVRAHCGWARWAMEAAASQLVGEPVPPAPVSRVDPVDLHRLLSAQQAAQRLGVTPATVRRWARSGRLPVSRRGDGALATNATGARKLYRLGDVLRLAGERVSRARRPADATDPALPQWVLDRRVEPPGPVAAWALERWARPWRQLSRTARRRAWIAAAPNRQHGQQPHDQNGGDRV